MTREEKALLIDELSEKLENNNNYYFTDAGGFTVAQINNFRRMCFEKGLEFKVYKNTLIKKALEKREGVDTAVLDEGKVLKGYSGIIFSQEAANIPAKVIKEFRKKGMGPENYPVLKAALIENEIYVGDENLDMLSSLKSKNELIGEVIGLLQSPAKNVISALESSKHKLAGIVKTLSEREN